MTVTFVTFYYPVRKDMSASDYLSQARKIIDSGIPLIVFAEPSVSHEVTAPNTTVVPLHLDTSWITENTRLPSVRHPSKDTAEFMCLMLMKLRCMIDALQHTDSTHLAWIDFRVFHVIKNTEIVQEKLRAIQSRPFAGLTKILMPGCWPSTYGTDILERVCWRYCGGFFLGARDMFQPAFDRQTELVRKFLPHLTWEVNYWSQMDEFFEWYAADHNDSIILNLPYSPRILRPGATTVYVDGGPFRRIFVGKAIEQYLFQRLCALTEDGVLVIPKTDILVGEEEHRRMKSTTTWDDPSLMNESTLSIPDRAIVCLDASRRVLYPRVLHYPMDDETFANGLHFPHPIPDWNDRKPLAVWRGGTSGIERPSLRSRVVQALDGYPHADVKYVRGGWAQNDNEVMESHYGERMTFEQQCGYKYMLTIDGNGAASSMLWIFGTGCVPIFVSNPETKYWLKDVLIPMVHYVPIASDLSDLREKLQWLVDNDDAAKTIAQNALEFGRTGLSPEAQRSYIDGVFRSFCDQSR